MIIKIYDLLVAQSKSHADQIELIPLLKERTMQCGTNGGMVVNGLIGKVSEEF